MKIKIATFLTFVCFLTVFGNDILSTSASMYVDTSIDEKNLENEILVEVVIWSLDKEWIGEIILDDGSKLSEHEYKIINKKGRIPSYSYSTLGNYYNRVVWVNNQGSWTLSAQPKSAVRLNRYTYNVAWSALSHPRYGFGSDWRFANNINKLSNQNLCHFYYAKHKQNWNLDIWRPDVSYNATVAARCNPWVNTKGKGKYENHTKLFF
ncbi:MAG: DUF2599 domain-containing protein [Mycoplasmatales bacterium]